MVHTTTSPKHERTLEDDDVMAVDEVLVPPQVKRQKKKQSTNRKPLCSFINYLGNKDEVVVDDAKKKTPSIAAPRDTEMEDAASVSGGVSSEMKKLSLDASSLDDDSSTASVETVNTSNKSVDACQRDDRFRCDAATPAVDRWKEPPPPLPRADIDDAFYVTSKCDSDTESDEEYHYLPREIEIRKRKQCVLHRWQSKNRKYNALPKFGTVKLYKI